MTAVLAPFDLGTQVDDERPDGHIAPMRPLELPLDRLVAAVEARISWNLASDGDLLALPEHGLRLRTQKPRMIPRLKPYSRHISPTTLPSFLSLAPPYCPCIRILNISTGEHRTDWIAPAIDPANAV